MNSENQPIITAPETPEYEVPWKSIDNWISIFLLALVYIGIVITVEKFGSQIIQSASLILVQLVYLLPLIVIFTYRRINPKALGFGSFKLSTLAIGCGMLIVSYLIITIHNLILSSLGMYTQGEEILSLFDTMESPVWFILVGAVLAPIVEELFFRGFLFQGFRQRYGWVKGLLLSSAIFAAAHLDPAAFIPTFILGSLLAYMYHRTNSVWLGVILHVSINTLGLFMAYVATHLPGFIPV